MDAMRNVASMAKSSDFKRTVRELKVSRANAHQPPQCEAASECLQLARHTE